MKLNLILAALLFTSIATTANAEGGYGGFAIQGTNYEADGVSDDADVNAIFLKYGRRINNTFSVEGRLGYGVSDGSVEVLGVDVDIELDKFAGIYTTARLTTDSAFKPYAIIGATYVESSASVVGVTIEGDETGLSYGAGVELHIHQDAVINLEYMSYLDKGDIEISGISLGINFQF
ncbi:porin family protein [Oceanicoccus sp. KOV_DT_Chl]|uniref:porin family protein n=1 Tax=Oceanicoccus sp. KOV_DT_Chl TaxID=1904639 RepID=UPI000C7B70F8|nr:porin family protein [Oceanicoccus sp. KOV_DT_Chl]